MLFRSVGPDGHGGPTIAPCGICEPCVAIAEGRHIDVIEMDAASHNGIDDVRAMTDAVRYAAAFVLVFVAAVFAAGLLAFLMKKLITAIGLRPVDRTMGAAFGLVRGVILLLAAAVVMDMTALKNEVWWQESKGAPILSATLKGLKPVLPEKFANYLN